jgi:hypothetical protein
MEFGTRVTEASVYLIRLFFFHSFINGSTALVGLWPLLQFRNLFYTVDGTPWTGDQPVSRPLPTHRTIQLSYMTYFQ